MTGAEVTKLVNATGLPLVEIAAVLSISTITLEAWMMAGIPEQFSGAFEAGLNWIEYLAARPTDDEMEQTFKKVDESMARSAKILGKQYTPPARDWK